MGTIVGRVVWRLVGYAGGPASTWEGTLSNRGHETMTSADPSAESESRRLRVAEPTGTGSSAPRPPELPLDNLPLEPSSFVGREREIARVKRLLSDRRLLTLRGPGGSGKTRLALAIAQEMVEGFESGVWWVELAPLSDPELVVRATAAALGVR